MTAARISRLSLRARLLFLSIVLVAVGLTVGSVVVTEFMHRYLLGRVDDQLQPAAQIASRSLYMVDPQRPRPFDEVKLSDNYLTYLRQDGTVVGEERPRDQPDLSDPVLPLLDTAGVAARGESPFDVPGEDGSGRWRVIALPVRLLVRDGEAEPVQVEGSVAVGISLKEVDATTSRLHVISLVSGASLLVVLTLVGTFAIRAGLRPLRRIERTLAAVADGDLSQRVPELAARRTELGRLSAALNSMFSQNEAAFEVKARSEATMRRFVADAGHELRTPLAGIKGFTKLYRMGGLTAGPDVDRTMHRIESETERLTRLVEDLLLLARLDEQVPLQPAPMDLRTVAADALHDIRALDPSRTVELTGPDGGPPAEAPAVADESRMRQVVTNLIGNAIAHTPEGTPIRIGVGTAHGHAIVEVADSGPGLSEDQARRVFDRFYRADDSRSRGEGGGAGLGLSIVKSLVTAQGGEIVLNTESGAGATFRVLLPRAAAPLPDDAGENPARS